MRWPRSSRRRAVTARCLHPSWSARSAPSTGSLPTSPKHGRRLVEEFWPGALTIVCHQQPSLVWDIGETDDTVAVRMPDDEIALDLLTKTGPLAVSSANLTGQPAAITCADAQEQLGDAVAVYLDNGPVPGAVPSTIVDLTSSVPRVLRPGAVSLDRLRKVVPELEMHVRT